MFIYNLDVIYYLIIEKIMLAIAKPKWNIYYITN